MKPLAPRTQLAGKIAKSELFQVYLLHVKKLQELRGVLFIPDVPGIFWEMDIALENLHNQILREYEGEPGGVVDATLRSLVYAYFNQGDV